MQDLIFEGESIFTGAAKSCIVDSGTSMITVPNADFLKMKEQIDDKWPKEEIYCDVGE